MKELTATEQQFFTESATQKGISIVFSELMSKSCKPPAFKTFASQCQAVIAGGFPRDCLLRDGAWNDVDIFVLPAPSSGGISRNFTLLADILANYPHSELCLARFVIGSSPAVYSFYVKDVRETVSPNITHLHNLVECGRDAAKAFGSEGIFLSFRGEAGGEIPNLNIIFREEETVTKLLCNFPVNLSKTIIDLFPTNFNILTSVDFDLAVHHKSIVAYLPKAATNEDYEKLVRYCSKISIMFPDYSIAIPNLPDPCPF